MLNTITGTVASGEIPFATGANVLSSSNEFTFDPTGTLELFDRCYTLPTITLVALVHLIQ